MCVVKVVFDDNARTNRYTLQRYSYFYDGEAEVGDRFVVLANGMYKVVRCVEVANCCQAATKYVIQKLDMADYERRMAREAERKKLLAKADKLIASQGKLAQLKELAKYSDEAKELYNQLRDLED